jgi:UDPglucose 6-dehydrogenase
MKIAVIGAGYVGTVTGTCLAELGHDVACSDMDEARIQKLMRGEVPFFEANLEPLLKTNLEDGRLTFTTDTRSIVKDAEVVFICVGTPPLPNGKPDMKPLEKAIQDVSAALTGYTLVVEKSTLPIRTGEWLEQKLQEGMSPDAEFDMAAVPQFLREGYAVQDFMKPDRIVIGANSQRAMDLLVQIYNPLNSPILITDVNSAELIKHASNAFLAMKISFINSIAQICEKTGADIIKVAKGLGMDKRISHDYLNAGVGYGGIFFPKDIASLVAIADE